MMLAFDKMPASVRRLDVDGRMHVETANISKANVCPYYGREIPYEGLEADRIYYMLRDPVELARAAPTFNNLPLLDLHIAHSADTPQQEYTIGSTGTDAAFNHPYLTNSLVIWTGDAVRRIDAADSSEDGAKELSCAYYYEADMRPGIYEGVQYDGVMRNIVGNHVALVREGRAGSDVVIGDSQLEMPKMIKSRKALMLNGALAALVRPLLAADQKLDLSPVLKDVTAANMEERKVLLATAIVGMATPKLAADMKLEASSITSAIDAILATDADPDDKDEIAEDTGDNGSPPAADSEDDEDEEDKEKPAMDANLIEARVMKRMRDIRDAETIVRPFIGALDNAPDSAAAVYRLALDSAKVDHTGVTQTAALRAMVQLLPKPGEVRNAPTTLMASDAASRTATDSFSATFGGASKLKRIG